MNITIVREDNLIIIDHQPRQFDLGDYELPENFWALQWKGTTGEIEFETSNQKITELPDWTAEIISEHNRLTEEQNQLQEQEELQAVYLANGQARTDRVKREQQKKTATELQKLKQQVAKLAAA